MAKRGTTADLSHIAEPLRPLAVEVSSLHEDPANARNHSDRNAEAVAASLRRYGQRKPIVVNSNGMIVEAGNCTLRAAKMLKWTTLAAVLVDDDPVTATGYSLVDNRTGELAEWDDDVLGRLLTDLQSEGEDLPSLGWADAELKALTEAVPAFSPTGPEEQGNLEQTSQPKICPHCGQDVNAPPTG
jgi:ParB-like chromosome segregation protein Spo0J